MKNKIIKKTPIIVLATLLLSIPITQTHAYTFNVDFADTGSSSSSSGKPGGNGSSGNQEPKYSKELSSKTGEENGYKYKETYTCKYNYNISSTNKVTINGYNMQNKKIIENSLNISDKNKIVAGTSIGLEIYEVKKISYSVSDIEVVYTKVKTEKKETKCQAYTCNYSCTARGSSPYTVQKSVPAGYACSKGNEKSTMHSCVNTTSSPTCSSYKTGWVDTNETITKRKYTSESNNYVKDCLKHAVKVAKGKANATGTSATYSIKVPESNNINKTSITTIQGKVTKEEKFNVSKNTEQKSGTRTVEYEYSTNPCMNVITSEVRYVSDSKYCNKDNEILIANETIDGRTHWHYFTPINTKSSDYITIELTKNTNNNSNNKKSNKECLYVLEKNPIDPLDNNKTSYVDLIQKTNDEKLVGDYTGNKSSKDYKYFKNGGTCYLTSVIKIPINQKFYQEDEDEDGNITFTGFNFYYRPINIYNPFPNGFSPNSYWKEWNDNGRKDPNMEKSYTVMTYSAININTSIVRNYKNLITDGKQNTYSSWNNMSSRDGKSNFISTQGVVTRHNTGDYYRIGEGPSVEKKDGKLVMTGSDNS